MKKTLSLIISAVLLTALSIIVFISCKKEIREIAYNTNQNFEKTEAQQVYEKIMTFREAREAYHADAKTNNGLVSLAEARSILDGAINYEFSDVKRRLEDTNLDTLRYAAPATNGEGLVAVNDLVDIYDKFAANIAGDPNSVNCFMIKYPMNYVKNNDIEIVFTRGNPPTPPIPPIPGLNYFDVTDNWIWAYGLGKCDHYENSDAANELTIRCNAMLASAENDSVVNYYGYMYEAEYENKTYDSLQSDITGLDYWLFHAEEVYDMSTYCITYEYMNLYLLSIYRTVIRETGCYHYSPLYNSPIREIQIYPENYPVNTYNNISHNAKLTYYKLGFAE